MSEKGRIYVEFEGVVANRSGTLYDMGISGGSDILFKVYGQPPCSRLGRSWAASDRFKVWVCVCVCVCGRLYASASA